MGRPRRSTTVQTVLLLPVVAFALTLLPGIRSSGWNSWLDGVLCGAAFACAALICWLRLRPTRSGRLPQYLVFAGLVSYTVGHVWWTVADALSLPVAQPSVPDALFLALQPLVFAAVVLQVRRRSRTEASAVWLDGVVGALAVAAVAAVFLCGPIARASAASGAELAVLSLYPLLDVVVLLALGGWASLQRWRPRPDVLLLFAGMGVQTATDLVFMLGRSSGILGSGGVTQVGWSIAVTLIAFAAGHQDQDRPQAGPERRWTLVTVPAAAAAVALALLLVDHFHPLPQLTVALAAATVLAALIRLVATLREVRLLLADRHLAVTDDLTGLTNRRGLHRSTPELLRETGPGHGVALLLLDLDRFKEVNDSLGHSAGDDLLAGVADRLRSAADTVTGRAVLLTRLGGDEFALLALAPDADLTPVAEALADAVHHALRPALVVAAHAKEGDEVTVRVRASIGITTHPGTDVELSQLLREADVAMYHAKASRLGTSHYRPETDEFASGDRLLDAELLRTAIESRSLVLHFQPKVDTGSGAVHGVEALVRWQHPSRGLLFPDKFLPMVEDLGLFDDLTAAVLDQSLDQAAAWRRAGRDLSVAVNVSAGSLTDPSLPGRLTRALTSRDLPASALEIEITEDSLMNDPDGAGAILAALREQGIRVAVDDYGTGYSSLAYLRRLAIDDLKLDRSFVVDLVDDPRALAIVRSTISLAHSLGLRLVAEGVEDLHTRDELAAAGCDVIQGWFYAKAMPPHALETWLDGIQAVAARPATNAAHSVV